MARLLEKADYTFDLVSMSKDEILALKNALESQLELLSFLENDLRPRIKPLRETTDGLYNLVEKIK